MKYTLVIISTLTMSIYFLGCSAVLITRNQSTDTLFKYDSQSDFVVDKAKAIQKRIPKPINFARCGLDTRVIRYRTLWNEWISQQHDDLTIDGLLYLYKMSSDDILRSQVLKILSHQNKERLGLLWREILRHPSISTTAVKNTAIFGIESIEMSRKE